LIGTIGLLQALGPVQTKVLVFSADFNFDIAETSNPSRLTLAMLKGISAEKLQLIDKFRMVLCDIR